MAMEIHRSILVCLLPLLLSVFAGTTDVAAKVTASELEAAMAALRGAGYNLFPNAIAATDLQYRLLTTTASNASTFTLFAPPDSSLFSLGLSAPDSHHHFLSLLRHVSPARLSLPELTSRNRQRRLRTLLPSNHLEIRAITGSMVTVNGIPVSRPNLYLGPGLAVHGLSRILGDGYTGEVPMELYSYIALNPDSELMRNDRHNRDRKRHGSRKRGHSGSGKNKGAGLHSKFFKLRPHGMTV